VKARVWTAPQADAQAHEAREWWKQNRPAAPDLFARELAHALALLADTPDIGLRYRPARIPGLRRLFLPATRYHLYYVHDTAKSEVMVLAIWSATRGRRPPLRRP
jgi:plasmid stabilization system protein ParE